MMKKIYALILTLFVAGSSMAQSRLEIFHDCEKGVAQINGVENGYAWVDLGLSSGLKWATCNVGAANPWDCGDYFAWGETTPKSVYDWSTYLDGRITVEEDCGTSNDLLDGITDIKGTQYDAARANMGGEWRMPTKEEMNELYSNCYWEWTTNYNDKGVKGYIVYKAKDTSDKGKKKMYSGPNSTVTTAATYSLTDVHIFLPTTGVRADSYLNYDHYGYYWSSSLSTSSPSKACDQSFRSDYIYQDGVGSRYYGSSVRGVCSVLASPEIVSGGYTIGVKANGCQLYDFQYERDEQVELTAISEEGYKFLLWDDGNTENPRTVTVTGNITYIAYFYALPYTITTSTNANMGTVSGGGTYDYNTTATLIAIPESGYAFKQWDDGNTENPRMVTVTGDKTYTAQFDVAYTITANSANNSANVTMGTVNGGGTYAYNAIARLTATPKMGYKFVQWNDGNADNPRIVTVTGDVVYTATFGKVDIDTLVVNQSCAKGVVQIKERQSGVDGIENGYAYVDLGLPSGLKWATCNVGAENPWDYGDYFAWGETERKSYYDWDLDFDDWNTYLDGRITDEEDYGTDKDLLNGITDIKGTQYDAARANMGGSWRMPTDDDLIELTNNCYWEWTDSYNGKGVEGYIVYKVKDASDKGKKKYMAGTVATVESYSLVDAHIFFPFAGIFDWFGPYGHYWSSSLSYEPCRAVILSLYPDEVSSFVVTYRPEGNSVRGVCSVSTTIGVKADGCDLSVFQFGYGEQVVITAISDNGSFKQWNDGNTQNPRTITVTGNATYVAQFAQDGYTITATPNNGLYGTVSGGGLYTANSTATLSATPYEGYKFVQWNDGNKENPRQIVVMSDMTYTAIFEEDADGIADITAASINIYTEGRTIIVENATDAITVSDALGRVVGKDDAHIVRTEIRKFPVPSSGVYVVKIGNRAASVLVR